MNASMPCIKPLLTTETDVPLGKDKAGPLFTCLRPVFLSLHTPGVLGGIVLYC